MSEQNTFTCTLEGFKRVVADFCKSAPTATSGGLAAGMKCVSLHYLGIEPQPKSGSVEEMFAVQYLEYASRREFERSLELSNSNSD